VNQKLGGKLLSREDGGKKPVKFVSEKGEKRFRGACAIRDGDSSLHPRRLTAIIFLAIYRW
jgi:hypothetical protein